MLTIQAPASKSVSHRMLMGAALAHGLSTVRHVLMSKDICQTMEVLTAAGAQFTPIECEKNQKDSGVGSFQVMGMSGKPLGSQGTGDSAADALATSCDMHESGTSCRLLTAILASGRGAFRIHGASRLHERPLHALVASLQELGVTLEFEHQEGYPPCVVRTTGFMGSEATINLDESSQYLSGLLLAAPNAAGPITLNLGGKKPVSWPYVALTLQAMETFGVDFQTEERKQNGWHAVDWRNLHEVQPGAVRFCLRPSPYRAGEYTVEGDWSGASYFLAAGVLGKEPLRVQGLRLNSLQGDKALLKILQDMGAKFHWEEQDIILHPSTLRGIDVDMNACPDLVPTVAVLAAFATGVTRISNVAHLRIKESDRIAAPAAELRKIGVTVEELTDGMCVHGLGHGVDKLQDIKNITFSSHNDHRIAMSLALLSLHGQRVNLDDPSVVQKSFPHFWELWKTL